MTTPRTQRRKLTGLRQNANLEYGDHLVDGMAVLIGRVAGGGYVTSTHLVCVRTSVSCSKRSPGPAAPGYSIQRLPFRATAYFII